jgi:hypothetical protein
VTRLQEKLRWVLLLAAMMAGGWLLMADSTECANNENEELCDKCGIDYGDNVALCHTCDDRYCFAACKTNEDPTACARRYNNCFKDGGDITSCQELACEGAQHITQEECDRCGFLDASSPLLENCKACVDETCFEICQWIRAEGCAQAYEECLESNTPNLQSCVRDSIQTKEDAEAEREE